jgi:hypothetical protein
MFKNISSNSRKKRKNPERLPWGKMLLVFLLTFSTGFTYMLQEFGGYFMGSLLGAPGSIYSSYDCPLDSGLIVAKPIDDPMVFPSLDRSGLLKSSQNKSLTSWVTYKTDHALRIETVDKLSYATKDTLVKTYVDLYKGKGSWHGAVDYSTSLLDDVNPYALMPFGQGRVVKAGWKNGYGNTVGICYKRQGSNGDTFTYYYGIGHLAEILVAEGDIVNAGQRIGKVGNTGDVFGALGGYHGHIGIYRDGYLKDPGSLNYVYPFYYPKTLEDILVKSVDLNLLILRGELAYSIVEDSPLQASIWSKGAAQFVAGRTSENGSASVIEVQSAVGTEDKVIQVVPVFNRYQLSVERASVLVGESQTIILEALDGNGNRMTDHRNPLLRVFVQAPPDPLKGEYVSPAAALNSIVRHDADSKVMENGLMEVTVVGLVPGVYRVEYSNGGSLSSSISWQVQSPELFQVIAPQETFEDMPVAFRVKPLGADGRVVGLDSAFITTFPVVSGAPQIVHFTDGIGEFEMRFEHPGIYDVRVNRTLGSKEVKGLVRVVVNERLNSPLRSESFEGQADGSDLADGLDEVNEEVVGESLQENSGGSSELPTEVIIDESDSLLASRDPSVLASLGHLPLAGESEPTSLALEKESDAVSDRAPVVSSRVRITIPEGDDYLSHQDDQGRSIFTFDDRPALQTGEQFPLLFRNISVPEGTDSVRVDACFNWTVCGNGVVLSKFKPEKGTFDYAFRYTGEVVTRKIVALRNGEELSGLIFRVLPLSKGLFTDVVKGVTDDEVYEAVKYLKEKGISTGNPDGSFGVHTALNRAAFVTFLARGLGVDFDSIEVGEDAFDDLVKGAWYEKWIYWAAFRHTPQLIKGAGNGKVLPDKPVWPEELAIVVLRLLSESYPETTPWYEGVLEKAEEVGLYTSGEVVAGKDMPRGEVALYLVRALKLLEERPVNPPAPLQGEQEGSSSFDIIDISDTDDSGSDDELIVVGKQVVVPPPVSLSIRSDLEGIVLEWGYDGGAVFNIYRRQAGENNFEHLTQFIGKKYVDRSATGGVMWEYVVDAKVNGVNSDTSEVVSVGR